MTEERKPGWRCKVCTYCGRCFEDDASSKDDGNWSGKRCDVCVGCGKCLRDWGLLADDADGMSGPTNWGDAFKAMDNGKSGDAPPIPGAPGAPSSPVNSEGVTDAASGATPMLEEACEADAVTGATPGVASACAELGLDDMKAVGERLGIKPPGVA